jgi:hypothetical protein
MKVLGLLHRRDTRPEQLAIASIIAASLQLAVVKGGKEKTVRPNARRRRDQGTSIFHTTLSPGPNLTGGLAESETPEEFGPRNPGQFAPSLAGVLPRPTLREKRREIIAFILKRAGACRFRTRNASIGRLIQRQGGGRLNRGRAAAGVGHNRASFRPLWGRDLSRLRRVLAPRKNVDRLALTPALSPGERVNHSPLPWYVWSRT